MEEYITPTKFTLPIRPLKKPKSDMEEYITPTRFTLPIRPLKKSKSDLEEYIMPTKFNLPIHPLKKPKSDMEECITPTKFILPIHPLKKAKIWHGGLYHPYHGGLYHPDQIPSASLSNKPKTEKNDLWCFLLVCWAQLSWVAACSFEAAPPAPTPALPLQKGVDSSVIPSTARHSCVMCLILEQVMCNDSILEQVDDDELMLNVLRCRLTY